MSTGNVVFIVLLVLAAGFFSYNVQRLVAYLRVGRPEGRFDHPLQRLKNVLVIALFQRKILRDPVAGPMHALIFWGFIVLTAGTIELFLQGIFPAFSYRFLPTWAYRGYSVSQDIFGVLVLGAVGFALYRRLVVHPRRLEGDGLEHTDALIILSAIAGLMITMFFANAFQIVIEPGSVVREKFVSHALAMALAGVSPRSANLAHGIFWWTHAVLILAFLNYLPYSKHLHIISSIPNVYFSNANGPRDKGVIRFMDLEAEGAEQFGAADVEHLTWKDLLDGYTCTE
jgi:nitrate reductase gamma subunit